MYLEELRKKDKPHWLTNLNRQNKKLNQLNLLLNFLTLESINWNQTGGSNARTTIAPYP